MRDPADVEVGGNPGEGSPVAPNRPDGPPVANKHEELRLALGFTEKDSPQAAGLVG